MATITADGLDVCDDCAMIIANGTLGAEDEAADKAHAEKIAAGWPDDTLVLACGEDCEEVFSSVPCDGCGSTLAGNRHEAVAFAR